MKFKSLAYLSLVAGATFSTSVMAQAQGQIVFQGIISAGTCTSTVNSQGTGNAVIAIPTIQLSQFGPPGAPATTPPVPFTINLENCAPGVTPYARFYVSTPDALSTVQTGHIANRASYPAPATGVDLLLSVNHAGGYFALASDSETTAKTQPRYDNDPVVTVGSDGTAELRYYARYRRHPAGGSPLTAGAFYAEVNYLINYD